ncbi:MAG: MFS transporter [Candidatus Saccharibacteria bacterium]|nr:MFS transporter [Candidatus Saccharibacteria bacterium]
MKQFHAVLANNLLSNVTNGYLWFALVFWLYLATQSVLVTGLLGGAYMLLVSGASLVFGAFVDRHHKKSVMLLANVVAAVAFSLGGAVYWLGLRGEALSASDPVLWLFGVIILIGAVIGNMRNIALSTTVTLLVPEPQRDKANGLVGAVNGIGFIVTSVISGLSVGLLGMGWTLAIAIALMLLATLHMCRLDIPEKEIAHDPELANKLIDVKGGWAAITAVPGLVGLVIFAVFNNLIGGAYMALMDPYGLTLFSVEQWGIMSGLAGTGFVIGGLLVGKLGLGKRPLRTLLLVNIIVAVIGMLFAIREAGWLFLAGAWLYMICVPFAEAAEQTVLQKVVPFKKQGRVFGLAGALESATAPITAFLIAPLAEFFIIPAFRDPVVQTQWSWLLGTGQMRGVAVVFVLASLLLIGLVIMAFASRSYRLLSEAYCSAS